MAPRGLSIEEKRVRLLEIFHETKEFYQLKELEKLGPKLKGIVSQTVKEILQGLVDDGLVQTDKIGTSNFFWSFPSQQGVVLEQKLQAAREVQKSYLPQIDERKRAIEGERANRIPSETRTQKLETLDRLKKRLADMEAELNAYGDSNPAKFEEFKRAAFLAKEAAYRWTDNYSIVLGHFTRQCDVKAEDIRQYLGIEETYEDIE